MADNKKIKSLRIEDLKIGVKTQQNNDDFISLTDMAKWKSIETGIVIANWLTTKFTADFMSSWEQMYNPNFNLMEFHKIRNEKRR
ncbi:MAG: KilA-N domain-containing protein [Candidatus Marinimicrobia bacterium]|nr:KilA-N domain-containing protein [Candidatus Neomarinimicrobiota bacterium]